MNVLKLFSAFLITIFGRYTCKYLCYNVLLNYRI